MASGRDGVARCPTLSGAGLPGAALLRLCQRLRQRPTARDGDRPYRLTAQPDAPCPERRPAIFSETLRPVRQHGTEPEADPAGNHRSAASAPACNWRATRSALQRPPFISIGATHAASSVSPTNRKSARVCPMNPEFRSIEVHDDSAGGRVVQRKDTAGALARSHHGFRLDRGPDRSDESAHSFNACVRLKMRAPWL